MIKTSVSEVFTWNSCQYKHDLVYNQNVVTIERDSKPAALGSMVHEGMAAALLTYHNLHYTPESDEAAYFAGFQAITKWAKDNYKDSSVQIMFEGEVVGDSDRWNEWVDLQTLAVQLTNRTLDKLDVLNNYQVATINGQAVVEYEFEYEADGVLARGYVDAVLFNKRTGLTELWDFKVRSRLAEDDDEFLNQQTAVYQYILKKLGLPVHVAIIFQIKSALPQTPKPNKPNKDGSFTMSRQNITTDWYTYRQALINAGLDPNDYEDMEEKLRGQEFWRSIKTVRYDQKILDRFWSNFVLTAKQMYDTINPVRQFGYACKMCPFQDWCKLEVKGENPKELIGVQYTYREET